MYNRKEGIIRISEAFSDRYTLIVDSSMMAVNMTMNSKTRMRWDLQVHKVNEAFVELSLLQLENVLLESDNPMVKDIAAMSQAFGKMYSELHLIVSHQGEIREVLNMNLIRDKWKVTKAEMEKAIAHSPEAKDIIVINDEIFNDKEKVKLAIGANDFINLYFPYAFGRKLPYRHGDIVANNLFNSNLLQWKTRAKVVEVPEADNLIKVNVTSEPNGILTRSWHNKTYKSFEKVIDISKLEADINKTMDYTINSVNGKLIKVQQSNAEIAHETLFTKMNYTMLADNSTKPAYKEKEFSEPKHKKGRWSFLADDMYK